MGALSLAQPVTEAGLTTGLPGGARVRGSARLRRHRQQCFSKILFEFKLQGQPGSRTRNLLSLGRKERPHDTADDCVPPHLGFFRVKNHTE